MTKPGWSMRTIAPELEARWTEAGWWDERSLGDLLSDGLLAEPEQTFTVFSADRPWAGTFGDLRAEGLQLAGGLRARGIGPGDPVAFQLPNWHEAAICFYAAAFLGAVVVPIVHSYGPKEVAYILRRTGVRALITGTTFGFIDFLANLDQLDRLDDALATVDIVAIVGLDEPRDGLVPYAELLGGEALAGPVAVPTDTAALIAYTSGTTADPKGVIHAHRTIGAEVRQLGSMHADDAPPPLVALPVGHAMGMLGALLIPVVFGEPIHIIDRWSPPELLALMVEHGLACGSGATYFLTSLLDHPDLTDEHLRLMRYVGLGGAAVPNAVTERARGLGISIVRMYGSTEHPSITGATHDDPEPKRLTTDGHPLAGVEIRLVDEQGADVAVGEPGEILSRGPDCCMGYTEPRLTEAAFDADGWFHTEDIGVLDADGYLSITDRKKDVIIRGGENVSAVEVEELLVRVPGVAEVAVVAAPDARYGERVCAFVRPTDPAAAPDLEGLRAALDAAGLAHQKWPEELRLVEDLPRTPSGKVQKAKLRQLLRDEAS
jgi:acyl-CoA synthetase (AMP-forming)/AMP-acid ligase II